MTDKFTDKPDDGENDHSPFPDAHDTPHGMSGPGTGGPTRLGWHGPYSETAFTAWADKESWQLGIHVDHETPIVLQIEHKTLDLAREQAGIMDFGLAMAQDETRFDDAKIANNALILAYCRDFYEANGTMIHERVAAQRKVMDVTPHSARMLRKQARSADAMHRISARISRAMARAMTPEQISAVDKTPGIFRH